MLIFLLIIINAAFTKRHKSVFAVHLNWQI